MKNRRSKKIRAYLVERGISIVSIARELAVSGTLVHDTISGRKDNRRTLAALLERGVPAKYLDLPKDMQNEEAA